MQDILREKDDADALRRYLNELRRTVGAEKNLLATCIADITAGEILYYEPVPGKLPPFAFQKGMRCEEAFQNFADTAFDADDRDVLRKTFCMDGMMASYAAGTVPTSEYQRRTQDGNILWMRTVAHTFLNHENGHVLAFLCTYDINREKLSAMAIQSIVNADYDFVGIANARTGLFFCVMRAGNPYLPKDRYERYNEVMAGIFADYHNHFASSEDMLTARDAWAFPNILKELENKKKYRYYIRVLDKTDKEHVYCMTYSYIDRPKARILVCRSEVTAEKETEQKQRQLLTAALEEASSAYHVKTDFLSNMSHDMRTPLNGVIGFTELGLKCKTYEEMRDCMEKIKLSGELLMNLINDMLDMSRIRSNQMKIVSESFDAVALFRDIENGARKEAAARGITFSSALVGIDVEHSANIRADKMRLTQILQNLLSNAFRFTPQGGQVMLTVTRLGTEGNILHNKFTVEDTGIGISAAFLPHIYEAFEREDNEITRAFDGSGLGLAIVRQLVDMMGGRIEVTSEQGKGTRFDVFLDVEVVAQKIERTVKAPKAGFAHMNVLLCEDNTMNAEIVRKLLAAKGCDVCWARNGAEGVRMFTEAPENMFDMVLMDIRMPVMDGLEAARRIRELPRQDALRTPIIALTANAYEEDAQASREAGMNAHLSKPLNPQLLYRTMAEYAGCEDTDTAE